MTTYAADLGARIAQARKAAGYSQTQLAHVLRSGLSTVARWEVGDASPNPERLAEIATRTAVDPGWLLTGQYSRDGRAVVLRCADELMAKGADLYKLAGEP